MAEARTVARPYADAALQFAVAAGTTKEWLTQLKMLATIAADEQTQRVIKNPRVTREQLVALFTDVAGKTLIEGGSNFIRLLAEYDRLIILPEIHEEYQRLLAEKQRHITAQVRSAQPLNEQQTQQLTAALAKRFDCTVSLEMQVDESLLGGALAQIGDLVIDGSLRGRLTRLAATLRS
jgi:F-type H+-transporting ATPase subunit delta